MEDLQRKYKKHKSNNENNASVNNEKNKCDIVKDPCDKHIDPCDTHKDHCDNHKDHCDHDIYLCDCVCTTKGHKHGCDLELCGDDCINVESAQHECCKPLSPTQFDINNVVLYPVEVNRIFDTILFQTFTDPDDLLSPDFDVNEICGHCPPCAETEVTIEKVCLNYDDVEVELTEDPVLDDYTIADEDEDDGDTFEFTVNGKLDKKCACACKGNPCCFKQRGVVVTVKGLTVEIKGRFGNSEFTASSKRPQDVVFEYGKLSGELCCPADGNDFILREDIKTLLSIDCIGRAKIVQHNGPQGPRYDLVIPGGLDLVCCLQNTVSTLVSQQLSLVGSVDPIKPKLVDAFSNVCDFTCLNKQCVESVKPTCKSKPKC